MPMPAPFKGFREVSRIDQHDGWLFSFILPPELWNRRVFVAEFGLFGTIYYSPEYGGPTHYLKIEGRLSIHEKEINRLFSNEKMLYSTVYSTEQALANAYNHIEKMYCNKEIELEQAKRNYSSNTIRGIRGEIETAEKAKQDKQREILMERIAKGQIELELARAEMDVEIARVDAQLKAIGDIADQDSPDIETLEKLIAEINRDLR